VVSYNDPEAAQETKRERLSIPTKRRSLEIFDRGDSTQWYRRATSY
jgi:hypothetical protein